MRSNSDEPFGSVETPPARPCRGRGDEARKKDNMRLTGKESGSSGGLAPRESYLHNLGAARCPLAMLPLRKLRRATREKPFHGFSGKPRGFCRGSQVTGCPSVGRPSSRASSASSFGFSAATSQGHCEGQVLMLSARCQAAVLVTPAGGPVRSRGSRGAPVFGDSGGGGGLLSLI